MYKRILAPCLTVTAFSAAVALYNSTHSLPSKHCSKIKLCPQPQWAEPPGLKAVSLLLVDMCTSTYGLLRPVLGSSWDSSLAQLSL